MVSPSGSTASPIGRGSGKQWGTDSGKHWETVGNSRGKYLLRGCPICDLVEQGRLDLGERTWVHTRSWFPYGNQEYLAAQHGLTWNALRGGWVPIREKTYRAHRWLYDDVYEWIEED